MLFYDPVERVVATLHPNHTWEKVVFDPWQQETWDVNDTVAALRPDPRSATTRTSATIFSRLPQADYLPTWHDLRTDAAQRSDRRRDPDRSARARRAPQKAAAHADTPTIAHFDALGRPFLTVAHNNVV